MSTAENLVDRRLGNGFRITKLLIRNDLSHWDRHFVRGISDRPQLTATQQKILDRIWREHQEGKSP